MNKQVTLSLELAREMFNSNNEQLKKLALENFTEAELTKVIKTPKEIFIDMWFGCTLYKDEEYPESVFLMKNGEWMFEQDFKNDGLYCRYDKVWKVFETEFGYNRVEIRNLIRNIVEQRFKLMGLTPVAGRPYHSKILEQRFKLKGLTPRQISIDKPDLVEQRFKLVGLTPASGIHHWQFS